MQHLNIHVAGEWMVSIPLNTFKQREAAKEISQGLRDGQTFIIIEPEARKTL